MAYGTGPQIAVVGAPGDIDTTKRNVLGATATFSDGNEYMYLPGVASTVAGSWVTINPAGGTFATALLTKTAVGPVAIATAATDATTEYGWYLVRGYYSGAAAGSDAAVDPVSGVKPAASFCQLPTTDVGQTSSTGRLPSASQSR